MIAVSRCALCLAAVATLLVTSSMNAQVPRLISYQGLMAQVDGQPLPDGNYPMTLRLYDQASGGTLLWEEVRATVPVVDGLFHVILGEVTPLTLPFNQQYWLGVAVNNTAELTPRTALASAPYSLRTSFADTASVAVMADSALTVRNGSITTVKLADGSVTLGKIDPAGATTGQVLTQTATGLAWQAPPVGGGGISSINVAPNGGLAVSGGPNPIITILPAGILEPMLNDDAVSTRVLRDNAVTTAKISNQGSIPGMALIATPTGVVWGYPAKIKLPYIDGADTNGPVIQMTNTNGGNNAMGLEGIHGATTGTGAGVRGVTNSTDANARAVEGLVTSTSPGGFSSGVRGINNGTGGLGIGVYGSQAGSGWGVYGTTPNGIGVHGNSTNGFGLYGLSTNGTGVYGLSTNGEAGRFEITNNANPSTALTGATNGGGAAVRGSTTGTGRAGDFSIANATNTSSAVNAATDGSGNAVHGTNSGTGRAGYFEITSPGNTTRALEATTLGTGGAAWFSVNNVTNSAIGLSSMTMGTGPAAQFQISNVASTANALEVLTNGTGRAIYGRRGAGSGVSLGQTEAIRGDNTDGPGVAGTSNSAVGVYGTSTATHGVWGVSVTAATAGVLGRNDVVNGFGVWGQSQGGGIGVYGTSQTGHAGQFEITNAASTGDAVRAMQSGLGRGVYAQINNTSNIVAAVRGETNGGGYGVFGQATGNGNAGFFQVSNPASTSSVMNVTTNGIGSGITVQLTNASNGARGVDVLQAGVGPGVFATSAGGNAVWGITSSISAAGVIGDNTFGEAVVGRNRGGNGVGAVVGRNDSSGYGVRGFNTKDGIGVLGQAGISGGTGVGGRFENVNAANGNDALQAATNGTGWAGNFTNANNSSATRGVRISTTAGQGGNALTLANGTLSLSRQHPYASNTVVDDAILVVTTAGNVTVPTGPPLVDGATVWVVNNAGAVVTVTNTTAGAFNINPGRAVQMLFVSTVSGANWIPVQP